MSNKIRRVQSDLPLGANYYIERRQVKAGEHFSPHWHDYFEFEIVAQGTGEHIYNNTRYSLQRGSAYLMSYYDFHELTAKSDMLLLKIQFNEHMLPQELNDFIFLSRSRFSVALDGNTANNIFGKFDLLEQEYKKRLPFSDIIIKSTISEIIIEAIRCAPSIPDTSFPSLLQKAVAYIQNHFREDIPLSELAEKFSVTPNYLGMLFTKRMGISFSDYLNTVRLRGACNLLAQTELSVKEIALSSGYNSFEHFEYTFKKKLSCTPLEFRRASKSK